ncbi:MAG TPA: NUDIX domain-containing protein [Alphaproteobacteria bacterium]|nr:NUDIX domain-containing protein [Alphaproteobacteria bacterium]
MTPLILRVLYRIRLAYRRLARPLTLGVRCIVVREDGHVLMVRHTYMPGWYLPGGGVDKGESIEAAVARELYEEVGVVPLERPQLFHTYSNFREHKSDHIVLYALRRFKIEPNPNHEIAEHGFFDPTTPPEATSEATRRRLLEWRRLETPAALW